MVQERTDIPLHLEKLAELRHHDMLTGYAAIVKFWGADHAKDQAPPDPARWSTSIKVEVILYEQMLFSPIERAVFHDYSDELSSQLAAYKKSPIFRLSF